MTKVNICTRKTKYINNTNHYNSKINYINHKVIIPSPFSSRNLRVTSGPNVKPAPRFDGLRPFLGCGSDQSSSDIKPVTNRNIQNQQ